MMMIPALFNLGWGWQTWRDGTFAWATVYHIILQFIHAFYMWES